LTEQEAQVEDLSFFYQSEKPEEKESYSGRYHHILADRPDVKGLLAGIGEQKVQLGHRLAGSARDAVTNAILEKKKRLLF